MTDRDGDSPPASTAHLTKNHAPRNTPVLVVNAPIQAAAAVGV